MVCFDVAIPESEKQGTNAFVKRLEREYPGILRYAIDGASEWYRIGLSRPESAQKNVVAYAAENNPVGAFMKECIFIGVGKGGTYTKELYKRYETWATENGLFGQSKLTKKEFVEWMTQGVGATYQLNGRTALHCSIKE